MGRFSIRVIHEPLAERGETSLPGKDAGKFLDLVG